MGEQPLTGARRLAQWRPLERMRNTAMAIRARAAALAAAVLMSLATPAVAAGCQNSGSFERWLDGVRQEAASLGISRTTIAAALDGLTYDPAVVARDRGQGVFQQSFLQFSDRMVSSGRLQQGARVMKTQAALFSRIEQKYGVPAAVIVAFWALESDFGTNGGKYPILRAVATLAYDCRRADYFRPELFDALRVIERGDLKPGEMMGDWAGELGALQITPSDYFNHAVDFDGDGRRDLIRSVPDTLASAANLLVGHGWKRGEPWLQEVRVPEQLPWDQADLAIQHPRSKWSGWGVTLANGRPLPADNLPASLLLPMGRLGPAFLAYNNFKAYLGWNKALVYSTTAAYLATRLEGAPPVSRGTGSVVMLNSKQLLELQQLLVRQGYKLATVDGKLGLATRAVVKEAQLKLGMPADSFPTPELIERLRAR
jgi:lytic murein transglycosylase